MRNKQFSLLKKEAESVQKTTTADGCMIPAETLIPARLLGTPSQSRQHLGSSISCCAGWLRHSMAVLPPSALHTSCSSGSAHQPRSLHLCMQTCQCLHGFVSANIELLPPILSLHLLGSILTWWTAQRPGGTSTYAKCPTEWEHSGMRQTIHFIL